jgi:hypothetical protein
MTAHPAWCSTGHCDDTGRDVRHTTPPDHLHATTDDVVVTTALVRDDDLGAVGELGSPAVLLGLTNTSGCAHPDGGRIAADVVLTPDEARATAARLLVLAALADAHERTPCP